jgi:SAM-dependent methyltransferase
MKNVYDDQSFWVDRVNMAKKAGDPTKCVYGNLRPVINNRVGVLKKLLKPTDRILDAGCSYGWLSRYLDNTYTGLDQTIALVEYGRELYPGINIVVSTMQDMPFEDDSFDWVISSCVKHGIVECEELGEMPKGRWSQIESEILRVAPKAIIWPSYSFDYEILER